LPECLFTPDGDGFIGTSHTGGAWDPRLQSGGAVLALVGHVLDDVPTLAPMSLSRLTADLVHPVPVGERLDIQWAVAREGKRIQVVDMALLVAEKVYVRARALRLREQDLSSRPSMPSSSTSADPAAALLPPDDPRVKGIDELRQRLPFLVEGADMRTAPRVDGGRNGVWVRPRIPVVDGFDIRPSSRLAFVIDFANLISASLDTSKVTAINPDVSAHFLRPTRGEWMAVVGDTRFSQEFGRGVSVATFSDAEGVFGFASTSQLLESLTP
jgi:hypothetical protein